MLETIVYPIILASGTGVVVSGLAAVAQDEPVWQWKKFLYSVGLASIAGLVIVNGFGEPISEDNAIPIVLQVIGASFIGNKANTILAKLKGIFSRTEEE